LKYLKNVLNHDIQLRFKRFNRFSAIYF